MKDISKLFEAIMDFKGLSYLGTEQSLMKKQRPVFFLAIVNCLAEHFANPIILLVKQSPIISFYLLLAVLSVVFVSTAFVATLPSYHKIGDSSSNSVMVRYATVNLVLLWLAYVVMVEPQLYKPRHCRIRRSTFQGTKRRGY